MHTFYAVQVKLIVEHVRIPADRFHSYYIHGTCHPEQPWQGSAFMVARKAPAHPSGTLETL